MNLITISNQVGQINKIDKIRGNKKESETRISFEVYLGFGPVDNFSTGKETSIGIIDPANDQGDTKCRRRRRVKVKLKFQNGVV